MTTTSFLHPGYAADAQPADAQPAAGVLSELVRDFANMRGFAHLLRDPPAARSPPAVCA